MAVAKRKKITLAILLLLALGIFLPPNINGARLKPRLASALGSALGHPVKIGSVSFRLLPRPGFELYDFEVADDPAFNAEPMLLCGKVTADLRLTSLWRGRLEIANLKLENTDRVPPSLNLVYLNGHWNLESLLLRAEQVPTAPTARKSAEQRARFPYIGAEAGRINIKIGDVKKPYALVNTDFAFWLAAENLWHVRLQGRPVRTDVNVSDTGDIKIEGELKRSSDLRQTPVNLQISWQQGQLGQLSALALGHDKGWRGALDMKAEVTGMLRDMHLTAQADLRNFRRYDINRRGMFDISTRCLGEYTEGLLDFNCSLPLESGGIRLSGNFSPTAPQNYDLSLVANRVPLSALATFAPYAKRTLPDDLSATGQFDAAFGFHAHDNLPQDWHGTGMTSPFTVNSGLISSPIQVSSIRFHLGAVEEPKASIQPGRKSRAAAAVPPNQPRSLALEPFSIELSNDSVLQARGTLRSTDYLFALKGVAPLERIVELGNITGLRSRIAHATGNAALDMSMYGAWLNFAPPRLGGAAHLENVTAAIPGVRAGMMLPTADVHFSDADLVLIATAQFDHSPVQFSGSITSPIHCNSDTPCPFQFDLRADTLAAQDLATLVGPEQKGWNVPFLSALLADKLPDFRASGTLSVATLKVGQLPVEKFIAHVEVGDHVMLINHINAKMANGTTQGEWRVDWHASPTRYTGAGSINGVSLEDVPLPSSISSLLGSWVSGRTNLNYALDLSGSNGPAMLASAQGHAEFAVPSGVSRALMLQEGRPTRFQALQGKCEINHQVLELLPSKFKAENRIYEISGTISLADKQANLRVTNSTAQWHISGGLNSPDIASQRLTAQDISAHVE
jgi:AsmA family/AsmA-like C-terminal region